jgi:prepilin-type N-terminal cleavage/methylation domain-containing protein
MLRWRQYRYGDLIRGDSRNEKGFTLVEMLLTIGLIGFLAAVLAAAYHFSIRRGMDWQARTVLEENARVCINRVADDVVVCERISFVDDSTMTMSLFRPGNVRYERREGRVFRNGFPLNSRSVMVDIFRIRPLPQDSAIVIRGIPVVQSQQKIRTPEKSGVFAVDIAVRYRQRVLSTHTSGFVRGKSEMFETE